MDRELQAWTRRVQDFAHEAFGEELRLLRVRLEDKEAIAALHWRGVPDEEDAEAAVREVAEAAEKAGFTTHWGRKVLEIRPPVRIDKGAGIVSLLRDTDLAAARLRRRRRDRPRRVPRPGRAAARWAASASAIRIGVRSDEGPVAAPRGGGLDGRGHGRRPRAAEVAARTGQVRFGDFLKATVLLSAGCATLLATLTVLGITREDDRTRDLRDRRLVGAGRADRRRGWAGERRPRRRSRACWRRAKSQTTLPELDPGHDAAQPAVAAAGGDDRRRARSRSSSRRSPRVAAGFTIIWALAWRRQERAVLAIEERDGVRFYVDRTSPLSPIQLIRTPGFSGTYLPT